MKMTDSFDKMIVCGDYEGDLNTIVHVLSTGFWFGEWRVGRDICEREREIIVLNGNIINPTSCPEDNILLLEDGRRCFEDEADDAFVEQWEAERGEDNGGAYRECDHRRECTLGEISALISPHLNKGTIEFVAVHASEIAIYHTRLLIRSDGSAEWHRCISRDFAIGDCAGTYSETQYYEPEGERRGRPKAFFSRDRRAANKLIGI
jgi:hypothetical protein